jgi:predicted alpha/beta-hydrolase family hydrolase
MPLGPEAFADASADPQVRGYVHRSVTPSGEGLVLTHGAGSNSRAPLLVAVAEALAQTGIAVLRYDLPFRQSRAFGPPRPGDAVRDREGLKNAVASLGKLVRGRVYLGGHSYGGRQATMLCADQPDLVEGLLLFSYPLHPPGKPDQLRVQHLPSLRKPALFVHGTRDPFGSPEELEAALKVIPAESRLVQVEGCGHDLGFKGKSTNTKLVAEVVAEFGKMFGRN